MVWEPTKDGVWSAAKSQTHEVKAYDFHCWTDRWSLEFHYGATGIIRSCICLDSGVGVEYRRSFQLPVKDELPRLGFEKS